MAMWLVATTYAVPTYAEMRSLPPRAAGDLILAERSHAPIEQIIAPIGGLVPPGSVEAELVESGSRDGALCVRRRWSASFRYAPGGDPQTATLGSLRDTGEIALPERAQCAGATYVHLNPAVSRELGGRALRVLRELPGSRRTRFHCTDSTGSALCASDASIRAALRTLKPWAVSREKEAVFLWLKQVHGAVTEVRFDPETPHSVQVSRSVPAPF